jgi:P27 family predicted phage terminase small subunit
MWKRIVPQLNRMRVLSDTDIGELAGMCDWWGRYVERMEKLKTLPEDEIGDTVERKLLASAREAWTEFQRICDRLGLSPAARTRLRTEGAAPAKPQSELLRLMNGSKQSIG